MLIFSIYKFPYLIFSLSISLETNTSALISKAFPWKPVLPWYPIKALEAISGQVVKTAYSLSVHLPGVLTWSGCLVWSHLLPLEALVLGLTVPLGIGRGLKNPTRGLHFLVPKTFSGLRGP